MREAAGPARRARIQIDGFNGGDMLASKSTDRYSRPLAGGDDLAANVQNTDVRAGSDNAKNRVFLLHRRMDSPDFDGMTEILQRPPMTAIWCILFAGPVKLSIQHTSSRSRFLRL